MGTTSLRRLLKNLCHNSQWEYAVFWKLKHRSRMLLTWEDGYCNESRQRSMQGVSDNVSFSETTGVTSFDGETSTSNGISAAYTIGLAVATMSCLLYSLGEGFVGRVASTGKHCWIFADEFNSRLLSEHPDEWQLQFAVGIKTIVLVPVVPHGVVQLGSLEMVTEDPLLLAHIKDMFYNLQHVPAACLPSTSGRDLPHQSSSALTPLHVESLAEPSSNVSDILDPNLLELMKEKDLMAHDGIQKEVLTINPDITSQFIGQDNFCVQGKYVGDSKDAEFSALLLGPTAVPFPQNQISDESRLKMTEFDMPDFSCLDEDLLSTSQSNFTKLRFSTQNNVNMNFCPSVDMMNLLLEYETGQEIDQTNFHGYLNFPAESELHKALVPAFHQKCIDSNPIVLGERACPDSSLINNTEFARGIESLGKSSGRFTGGGDTGNLLDSVISNSYDASGDIASNKSNDVKSPITSSGWFASTRQAQTESRYDVLGGDHLDPRNSLRADLVSQQGSSSGSSLKSMMSKLIDDEQQKKVHGRGQSRKGTKLSHFGPKKARLGDVERPKPRPRDRQMIQDRLKELRELVPNGGKYSIDALLDQTIKHMLFLRSVTNRAEKLKKCVNLEVSGKNNSKSSESQGHQNGASWAFDLGSQFGVCPIIVKDLDQPGHMLIEMLCEEHEIFLEIAQVIRQLKLTILKGVLETRLDKTWAHFVVEACAGFQRMDIFWPLMRLLQQNSPVSSMF